MCRCDTVGHPKRNKPFTRRHLAPQQRGCMQEGVDGNDGGARSRRRDRSRRRWVLPVNQNL
jgi:hypothetical protein